MVLESFHALSRLTQSPATPPSGQLLGPSELFTLFFITLGPIKLLTPFVRLTRGLDDAARRRLAVRATAIATAAVFAGGFLGVRVLSQWHVSTEVVLLAGGLVLLLVALALVLEQFEPPHPEAPGTMPVPPSPFLIAFPGIVTPYGIAVVIVLLAGSPDARRTMLICGVLVGMLVLDLVTMLFAHPIVRSATWLLQIFGAVLGVLQVALALQIMLTALRHLGVLHMPE